MATHLRSGRPGAAGWNRDNVAPGGLGPFARGGHSARRAGREGRGYDAPSALTSSAPAISLGDPSGIGPEVVVRALAERLDLEAVVFGDPGIIERAASRSGVRPPPPER